jgi:hypothetical protein
MNKTLVWMLFGTITLMQMQGNMYYAFVHMEDFQGWSELFGLIEEDVVYQKRVLSAVSGAILPLVALGFIKSLVDYIKPESQAETAVEEVAKAEETPIETKEEIYTQEDLEGMKEWEVTLMDGLEDEPISEEVEERDEDHDLDLVLNEMVEDLQEEELPQVEEPINEETPQVVSGYYGDIVIDGNGIQVEESDILPVNSNTPRKNTGLIDNAGSVHLNPMRL